MAVKSQDYNPNSFDVSFSGDLYKLDQDMTPYLEYAAQSRINETDMSGARKRARTTKPFCILPDIVAIEILTKYNIDVHSPTFGTDPMEVKRFRSLMLTEYKGLLTSNIVGNASIIT